MQCPTPELDLRPLDSVRLLGQYRGCGRGEICLKGLNIFQGWIYGFQPSQTYLKYIHLLGSINTFAWHFGVQTFAIVAAASTW